MKNILDISSLSTEKNNSISQFIGEQHNKNVLKMTGTFSNLVKEEEKLIILIDIVGFSKDSTRDQVYKIYLFQHFLANKIVSNKIANKGKIHISHFVPTGDGSYIITEKCQPDYALTFLTNLISGFKNYKPEGNLSLSIRASALIGKVVPFIDIARHINYIGQGMNEAARILSYGQKALEEKFLEENPDAEKGQEKLYSRNSLFLGDSLAEALDNYKDACNEILTFNNLADKHGLTRNVSVLQGIK
ncbi:MAG: hypothetical protein K6C97_06570 [Treponema sp.]|nr:hypothetical protein [Treponema sp.]